MLEFFTAQVNNDHTRKAYLNATRRFAAWCGQKGIGQLADVQAFHVAAFIKELQGEFSSPTVKQHLAALRMLFDWLVTGHVLDVNPAHAVRGPKYVVKKGKTPVLNADEARELLDSIKMVRKTADKEGAETEEPALVGLRDRALIGVMVYTLARINAVLQMKVRDYFVQGRRGWVRLHEKGGKEHEGCLDRFVPFSDHQIMESSLMTISPRTLSILASPSLFRPLTLARSPERCYDDAMPADGQLELDDRIVWAIDSTTFVVWPASTVALGVLRVRTQSRKLAMCAPDARSKLPSCFRSTEGRNTSSRLSGYSANDSRHMSSRALVPWNCLIWSLAAAYRMAR